MQQNILFATDLDGTLLNDEQMVAPMHAASIKNMCNRGLLFTIATARSPMTAMRVINNSNVCLSAPAVCLNGALLWDSNKNLPVKSFPIPGDLMSEIWKVCLEFDLSPRMYACSEEAGNPFITYYRDDIELSVPVISYLKALEAENSKVCGIKNELPAAKIISCSYYDHFDLLNPLFAKLCLIEGIKINFYTCTYREGYYFLEFCSSDAGKGVGARAAAELAGAELLYVFGDNLNDLDMFSAADRSFAPSNAVEKIKNLAHEIIPSNNDGGVILSIEQSFTNR